MTQQSQVTTRQVSPQLVTKPSRVLVGGGVLALICAGLVPEARATETTVDAEAAVAVSATTANGMAPVPPLVEDAPVASAGANYCFDGPHPADPAVGGGVAWEATGGRHLHPYPPLDLRLFALRDGCYFFIGDPADFGYRGQTYAYYGAHPVAPTSGGGWCFMIGGHAHLWGPWSSMFVAAGPWFYWQGSYDPFFWSYWPYYAVYYRHHYPRYYGGGRYARGGWHGGAMGGRRGIAVAPAIGPVPAPSRATATGAFGVGGGAFGRNGSAFGAVNRVGDTSGWRRDPAWRSPGTNRGAPNPTPAFTGTGRSPSAGSRDGWVGGNNGWTSGPGAGRGDGGGWRSAPRAAPTPAWNGGNSSGGSFFRSGPATVSPSFRSGGGGQFAPRMGGRRGR